MARLASDSELVGAGVYGFLRVREEQRVARRDRDFVARDGTLFRHVRHRLVALRAGEPVELKASDLPRWARVGVDCQWWLRAVVGADDSITFVEDDGSRWLEENGL